MTIYDTLRNTPFKELDELNSEMQIVLINIMEILIYGITDIEKSNSYINLTCEIDDIVMELNQNNLYSILKGIPLLIKLYNIQHKMIREKLFEIKQFNEWLSYGYIYRVYKND